MAAAIDWLIYRQTDSSGKTLFDQISEEGFKGFRNDDRVILESRRRSRVALLEVGQILDDKRVLCLELLDEGDPEPRLFVDQSWAAQACRFDVCLALVFRMPHYWRVRGAALPLPPIPNVAPKEVLRRLAEAGGGSLDQDWLFERLGDLGDQIDALYQARRQMALLKSDFSLSMADYALEADPSDLRQRLEAGGCWEEPIGKEAQEKGFQWRFAFPAPEDPERAPEELSEEDSIGAALVMPGTARLQALRRDRMAALKKRFEAIAGDITRLEGTFEEDLAAQLAQKIQQSPENAIPESLLQDIGQFEVGRKRIDLGELDLPEEGYSQADVMARFMERENRKLLDQTIPQLDGKTPREAARDPHARPKLAEWLKGVIQSTDRMNLEQGSRIDADWMVRELGLDEKDFPPPPPPRARPARDEEEDDEYEDDWESEDENSAAYVPFASCEDLTDEEVDRYHQLEELVAARMSEFESADAAMDAMSRSGCSLVEDAREATRDEIGDFAFELFKPGLICAWLAIVPDGQSAALMPGAVRRHFQWAIDRLEAIGARIDQGRFDQLASQLGPKPETIIFLWESLSGVLEMAPAKLQLSPEEYFDMLALTIAAANALEEATK